MQIQLAGLKHPKKDFKEAKKDPAPAEEISVAEVVVEIAVEVIEVEDVVIEDEVGEDIKINETTAILCRQNHLRTSHNHHLPATLDLHFRKCHQDFQTSSRRRTCSRTCLSIPLINHNSDGLNFNKHFRTCKTCKTGQPPLQSCLLLRMVHTSILLSFPTVKLEAHHLNGINRISKTKIRMEEEEVNKSSALD